MLQLWFAQIDLASVRKAKERGAPMHYSQRNVKLGKVSLGAGERPRK